MPKYGKIARLPRKIRDELNRRLDDGEPGVQLVAWLNGLPEAKQVIERDFKGREISEQNLTDWKAYGYLDWQAQREALEVARELRLNGKELADSSSGELTENLTRIVAGRYAVALYGWNGEFTDEMRRNLRGLRALSREVVRLRRSDQFLTRMELEREWLALEQQKTDEGMKRRLEELAKDGKFGQGYRREMTQEEINEALQRVIGKGADEPDEFGEAKNAKIKVRQGKTR